MILKSTSSCYRSKFYFYRSSEYFLRAPGVSDKITCVSPTLFLHASLNVFILTFPFINFAFSENKYNIFYNQEIFEKNNRSIV